jgi:hypothetical protein
MDATDIKVYGVNFLSIVLTFSDLMDGLKFIALIASIGYTIHKWYLMAKKK